MTVKQCYWVNLQCAVGNVASVTLGYTEPIWNVEYQGLICKCIGMRIA